MPQLDIFSFGPQVFWLTVVFFVLYFVILKKGLTNLYRILMFRKKFLLSLHSDAQRACEESQLLRATFFRFLSHVAANRGLLESFFKLSDTFVVNSVTRNHFFAGVSKNVLQNSLSLRGVAARQWLLPLSMKKGSALRAMRSVN